jgi:hypothetical protein
MDLANTLAYYDAATIVAMTGFIVQAPGGSIGPGSVFQLLCSKKSQKCQ